MTFRGGILERGVNRAFTVMVLRRYIFVQNTGEPCEKPNKLLTQWWSSIQSSGEGGGSNSTRKLQIGERERNSARGRPLNLVPVTFWEPSISWSQLIRDNERVQLLRCLYICLNIFVIPCFFLLVWTWHRGSVALQRSKPGLAPTLDLFRFPKMTWENPSRILIIEYL